MEAGILGMPSATRFSLGAISSVWANERAATKMTKNTRQADCFIDELLLRTKEVLFRFQSGKQVELICRSRFLSRCRGLCRHRSSVADFYAHDLYGTKWAIVHGIARHVCDLLYQRHGRVVAL